MPRQHKCRTLNGATSTGVGSSFKSRGHNSVGLFVIAKNLDTANDSLEVVLDVEHKSEAGSDFAGPVRQAGTGPGNSSRVGVDETGFSDPNSDGDFAAFVYAHGIPGEHFRARITTFTDAAGSDLEVEAWIYFGNWNGPGREFREVT